MAGKRRLEWQDLAPGDGVPMSPDGKHGIDIYSVDRPRSMVWGTPGDTTGACQLCPRPDGTTRLLAQDGHRTPGPRMDMQVPNRGAPA